ncbi:MAG TPA: winged helix-turn-helix domain-containing protein [Lachnoclostridium phocaeense]|uniref:Winged helix-turn-helix domain-containing protein n=1 Tax=Lachnoclostridium phocaeense TaxID=1871021 RepID=A0A921I0N9_9FIRM|nr:winged helix-turn-helix domain-containing protein [Lachnoclostridium phocaeense]
MENQIIQLLTKNNRLNQKQIVAKTGRFIASVQQAMKKLSEQGKIVREGGKRFGHWKVK